MKPPTHAPLPTDTRALQQRVRELEDVVDKYRTKRVGPYHLTITMSTQHWSGIVAYLKSFYEAAQHGPDALGGCGGGCDGSSFNIALKSNQEGGHGEA